MQNYLKCKASIIGRRKAMKDKNNNNSMQRSLRMLQEMDPQFIPLSVMRLS